jgi:CheY-like chemotaxis protein
VAEMKKNCVIIVDDEEVLREILSEYLRLQGLDTETAADGIEGLNKFTSHPFEVVLTDIPMPQMAVCLYQLKSKKYNRKPLLL